MTMMPSIFGEDLFDDFMDFPFGGSFLRNRSPYYQNEKNFMKTDIKESDSEYELNMDLPGVKKEDLTAKLEKGYLTIQATQNVNNDEKDENDKYIRRERYSGNMSRSFYVGENIMKQDIKAKFENGILKLTIPKKDQQVIEKQNAIAIEG